MNSKINAKQKIVFLGDQSVGKTSIINRFIYDSFESAERVHSFFPVKQSVFKAHYWYRFHFKNRQLTK